MTRGMQGRLGAVLACALLAAACGGGDRPAGGDGAAAGPPVNGGTAVVAVKSDFDALNPVTVSALATDDVVKYMLFTPLVAFDEKLNPVPHLAERWELAPDAVTFHLRGDVRWHDGRPVTAEDVKFTFDLAKDPKTASQMGSVYLGGVTEATVVDPRTIRFTLDGPQAQPLDNFWWAPVPKHVLESVPREQLAQNAFNQKPVGSGPFRFDSWQKGDRMTLVANDSFAPSLGGRPRVDRVVFRIIPEATARLTELRTGGVDVNYTVLPDEAKQLEAGARGITVHHYPSREFTYLGWNNERAPFDDPRVRRALSMAVDREALIGSMMFGYARQTGSVIPPISPMAPDLPPIPHDTAQAKRLLAEAGWTDSDRDGTLDRGGEPLTVTIVTNAANKLFTDVATQVQAQLQRVGVRAELQTVEFQTMLRQHKARDYQGILTNWTWDYFKADPTPLFSCREARKPQSANRAGYCSEAADAAMQRALRATDDAAAKQAWAEFARVVQQDQPVTVLFWAEEIAGVGPRLQGVRMDARSKLATVREWWIPADRQQRR
jgi:peptide/nickel transport system substrate-binding protein